MSDHHNIAKPGTLDVGDRGVDKVGDPQGRQIGRPATAAWEIDREDCQFRCFSDQFGDREVPAVAGVRAAVDQHQARQCHLGQ